MSTSSNMICAIYNIVIHGMFLIANDTMKSKAGIFIVIQTAEPTT